MLSILIGKAMDGDIVPRYRIKGRNGEEGMVSHLLFANYTLICCKDSEDQLAFLWWALAWFEALPNLRINLDKSYIYPVGRAEDEESLALELRCQLGFLPTNYLGLPLVQSITQ